MLLVEKPLWKNKTLCASVLWCLHNTDSALTEFPTRRLICRSLQVEVAVKDGFDVRGFFYWTLIDNFEWNFAWVRSSCHAELLTAPPSRRSGPCPQWRV